MLETISIGVLLNAEDMLLMIVLKSGDEVDATEDDEGVSIADGLTDDVEDLDVLPREIWTVEETKTPLDVVTTADEATDMVDEEEELETNGLDEDELGISGLNERKLRAEELCEVYSETIELEGGERLEVSVDSEEDVDLCEVLDVEDCTRLLDEAALPQIPYPL